ncbi:MAG TPA: uridine kinase [Pseudonocardiaceae bacterium]|nr:uridine kinase [Pseudonocardiaceae bacterium]
MPVRPVTNDALRTELADTIAAYRPDQWLRVAVDGAPAAGPGALADGLAEGLRLRGRPVLRVRAADFLRPASLRFEHGRTDPDALRTDWLDAGGLAREVLDPLEPAASGRVLPALWDAETDRASRAGYVELPPGGVLLLDGSLLLGHGLRVDLTVHLAMSQAALARQTDATERWTLPAYQRYADEVGPERHADVVVLVDHPNRPAIRHNRALDPTAPGAAGGRQRPG